MRVYARVLVPPKLYIHTYTYIEAKRLHMSAQSRLSNDIHLRVILTLSACAAVGRARRPITDTISLRALRR